MAERRRPEPRRLDQPRDVRRIRRPRREADPERFGRFAETFARFMGTAQFLGYMTAVIVVWLLWNIPAGPDRARWDEYPFIFLTLILSLQASYAAPLILLAQNRQEARDRVTASRSAKPRPSRTPTWSSWPARSPACDSASARSPPATSCAQSCANLAESPEAKSEESDAD